MVPKVATLKLSTLRTMENVLLIRSPWGPATANDVILRTEMHVIRPLAAFIFYGYYLLLAYLSRFNL